MKEQTYCLPMPMKIGKTWNKILLVVEIALFFSLLVVIIVNKFFVAIF